METETGATIIIKPKGRLFRIKQWLVSRKRATLNNDNPFLRTSMLGLWLASCIILVVTAMGMPTGMGAAADGMIAILIGTIGMIIFPPIIAFLLALIYLPLPRKYAGGVIYVSVVIFAVFYYADAGLLPSIVLSCTLTLYGIISGLMISVWISRSISKKVKLAAVAAVMIPILIYISWPMLSKGPSIAVMNQDDSLAEAVLPLEAENPAEPGDYRYSEFTYGSGKDRHRTEFGENADLISHSVDASIYIEEWPKLRSFYWGFDQNKLPVNGRVWMPEGEGPYPLVLIVHGNHLMEQFSDEGYAYLGEMLASRGFIAVSVDENFLNYSVWQDIPDNDMKVRAWMLLKHLQQIAVFNTQQDSPFYKQVDMEQVALIGHSRGGQAVAMAADYKRWFAADRSLQGMSDMRIQSVIAIAPTDKVVNKQSPSLRDTNYLSLQGAMDGDVNNFYGERQYMRTSYSSNSDRFKATLYIGEANHSQFNTDWGSMDDSLPGGLLLNRAGMMEAKDQRQVAKVYVSAFLEASLHGRKEYTALFRDYRTGLQWLPQATYYNRFEESSFRGIARFDEDMNQITGINGVTAEAEGIQWAEKKAEDRDGNSKGTRGVQLEWSNRGVYTLNIPELRSASLRTSEETSLTFALTSLGHELEDVQAEEEQGDIPIPSIEIELESGNGAAVKLPLEQFMSIKPLPHTDFTLHPWLEEEIRDGKYKEATEPVFQTFTLPLDRFRQSNPQFNPSHITRIAFHLSGEQGKIMLDDIGMTD